MRPSPRMTLEWLFTSPKAFGIVSATPLQRAFCRAADGLSLDDLEDDPYVIEAFGGPQALDELPAEPPFEIHLVAATRSGKSILGGALAVQGALTCDLETGTTSGDSFEVPIIAITTKKARVIFRHLAEGLFTKPSFRAMLVEPPTRELIRVRRPHDGRVVDITVTAGARAGGASVGVWCCAMVLDEAARMRGEADGVVNFDETRRYAISRIRPGGHFVAVTSPHAPFGPIYDSVQDHWGRPTRKLLVVRGTGPQLNPTTWTPQAVQEIRETDDAAYESDVLGNFAAPEYAFFHPQDVDRATRQVPEDAPPQEGIEYGAAIDPATRSNAFTFVIAGKVPAEQESEDRYVMAVARQWIGKRSDPLNAKLVFLEILPILKQYGVTTVWTDQWGFDPFRVIAQDVGFELVLDERTQAEKDRGFESLRTKLVARDPRVQLHPDPMVRRDLIGVTKKLTPTGIRIVPATTSDGRHGDYAPAIERAIEVAANQGAGWLRAMGVIEQRGYGLLGQDPATSGFKPTWCAACGQRYVGRCPKHGLMASRTDVR